MNIDDLFSDLNYLCYIVETLSSTRRYIFDGILEVVISAHFGCFSSQLEIESLNIFYCFLFVDKRLMFNKIDLRYRNLESDSVIYCIFISILIIEICIYLIYFRINQILNK